MNHLFLEKVLFSIYHLKYGPAYGFKIIKILNKLNESQWLPYENLVSYQNDKLRKLIIHVYSNVPYYRELMNKYSIKPQDIRSVEDLKYFPLLTKSEIKNNIDRIISGDIKKRNPVKASTSGTTGQPLIYYRDMDTFAWREAARLRGWSWANYKIGCPVIKLSSREWPSLIGKIRIGLIKEYEFPAFAEKDDLVSYFHRIRKLSPFCLTGFASNLYRIAAFSEKNIIDKIQIPIIFSTAELLYDYQRDYLKAQFNSEVFDYYGCNEIGSMAYECELKTKHITLEHVIFEVTDSRGNSINDKPGEIVLTDLDNYAMPFIRYKIGDVGTITEKQCGCGRGLSILKSVDGRAQDFLRTADGDHVPAIFFPGLFRQFKGIEQYQIIQTDISHIILKIVKNQFYLSHDLSKILWLIKNKIGKSIEITVEECSHIPLTGRGKARLVISQLPAEFNN